MAFLEADQIPTPQERLNDLEAEVEFMRTVVRALIARTPADPILDGPLYAAIKAFNEASQKLPNDRQEARNRAWKQFDLQHIHRMR